MNSHRDDAACIVDDVLPDRRRGPGPEFDQLLDASSLGAPDVLRHEAITPDAFFVELDAALDEDHANEAKEQTRPDVREGDVDDALLRLIERGAQPSEEPPTARTDFLSCRPTWTDRTGSLAVPTPVHALDETDYSSDQLIRLWYLPPSESRVVVSFVEYGRPSKVRALLSALLASPPHSTSIDVSWKVNVFSYLREDVARSMVSLGLAHQDGFEPIVSACSSAIEASHIIDEVDQYLIGGFSDPLSIHTCVAELSAGPQHAALEASEPARRHSRRIAWRAAIRPSDHMTISSGLLIPMAPDHHDPRLVRDNQCWSIERSGILHPLPGQLWVCVRRIAVDYAYPVALVVAPLISTATIVAFALQR